MCALLKDFTPRTDDDIDHADHIDRIDHIDHVDRIDRMYPIGHMYLIDNLGI